MSILGLGPGYRLPGYRLTVEEAPAEADVEILPHAPEAYNEGRWPQRPPWRPLAIFLRQDAAIVAPATRSRRRSSISVPASAVSPELAKQVGEAVGVERTPIRFDVEGGSGTLTVGAVSHAEIEPYKRPDGSTTTLYR